MAMVCLGVAGGRAGGGRDAAAVAGKSTGEETPEGGGGGQGGGFGGGGERLCMITLTLQAVGGRCAGAVCQGRGTDPSFSPPLTHYDSSTQK